MSIKKYIAACPMAPEAKCQACEEDKNDYHRIVICYQCWMEDNTNKVAAVDTNRNAWATSNNNGRGLDNTYKEKDLSCSSFIFCGDCISHWGILGFCSRHINVGN